MVERMMRFMTYKIFKKCQKMMTIRKNEKMKKNISRDSTNLSIGKLFDGLLHALEAQAIYKVRQYLILVRLMLHQKILGQNRGFVARKKIEKLQQLIL